jgi:hypothetical protein
MYIRSGPDKKLILNIQDYNGKQKRLHKKFYKYGKALAIGESHQSRADWPFWPSRRQENGVFKNNQKESGTMTELSNSEFDL